MDDWQKEPLSPTPSMGDRLSHPVVWPIQHNEAPAPRRSTTEVVQVTYSVHGLRREMVGIDFTADPLRGQPVEIKGGRSTDTTVAGKYGRGER